MSRKLLAPLALACMALGATQANAANLSVGSFADGFETVAISLAATAVPPHAAVSETGEAGGLLTTVGANTFTAYCVDLYQNIGLNQTYTDFTAVSGAAHAFANPNANTDIGKLFSEGNVLTSAVSQAAFQIAIWEIAYETTAGPYSVSSGVAEFTGGTAATSGALTMAQGFLNSLPTTDKYALTVFESPTHQDLVVAAPVPEPSTYALMAAGLLTVGFVARRRSSKQA